MSVALEVCAAPGAGRELLHAASAAVATRSRSAHAREQRFGVITVLCVVTPYRVLNSDEMESARGSSEPIPPGLSTPTCDKYNRVMARYTLVYGVRLVPEGT